MTGLINPTAIQGTEVVGILSLLVGLFGATMIYFLRQKDKRLLSIEDICNGLLVKIEQLISEDRCLQIRDKCELRGIIITKNFDAKFVRIEESILELIKQIALIQGHDLFREAKVNISFDRDEIKDYLSRSRDGIK